MLWGSVFFFIDFIYIFCARTPFFCQGLIPSIIATIIPSKTSAHFSRCCTVGPWISSSRRLLALYYSSSVDVVLDNLRKVSLPSTAVSVLAAFVEVPPARLTSLLFVETTLLYFPRENDFYSCTSGTSHTRLGVKKYWTTTRSPIIGQCP